MGEAMDYFPHLYPQRSLPLIFICGNCSFSKWYPSLAKKSNPWRWALHGVKGLKRVWSEPIHTPVHYPLFHILALVLPWCCCITVSKGQARYFSSSYQVGQAVLHLGQYSGDSKECERSWFHTVVYPGIQTHHSEAVLSPTKWTQILLFPQVVLPPFMFWSNYWCVPAVSWKVDSIQYLNGMISKVWFSEKVSGELWVWGFKDLLQGMGRNGGAYWHYQVLDIYIYVEADFWQIQLYCLISNNKYFQPRFLFVKIVT